MDNVCLTLFLLCFAFSSFVDCASFIPYIPFLSYIYGSKNYELRNEKLCELVYNLKSNDEDSGRLDWVEPFALYINDKSENKFRVQCYLFHIDMLKCRNPIIRAATPSCKLKKDASDDVCRACFYADFVIENHRYKFDFAQLLYMNCNKYHYQNPTIPIPLSICQESNISPDCHPD